MPQFTKKYRLPCRGINPRTGKLVGSRHRWHGNVCIWCNRFLESVIVKEISFTVTTLCERTEDTMYTLSQMTVARAKQILQDCLTELSGMEVEDLTTFELRLLHRCAENPPRPRRGCEDVILNIQKSE